MKQGIADAALDKEPKVDASTYFPRIQELQNARVAAATELEKKASEEYLAKAATDKNAQKMASGLIYSVVTEGTGASPKASTS